jgi:hypothetical protein
MLGSPVSQAPDPLPGGQSLRRKLKADLKKRDKLREFIVDDDLVLYLFRGTRVIFLSIKHHRQLSFDLLRFWS